MSLKSCDMLKRDLKYYEKNCNYKTALDCCETLIDSFNEKSPKFYYKYAFILFKDQQYRRSIDFILKKKLSNNFFIFGILLARCYFAVNESIEALNALDFKNDILSEIEYQNFNQPLNKIQSQKCLLEGEIHEQIENTDLAIESYKRSVLFDIKNREAIKNLLKCDALSSDEANSFLKTLPWEQLIDEEECQIYQNLYYDLFNITDTASESTLLKPLSVVSRQQKISAATRDFNNSFYQKAYKLIKQVLNEDQYNTDCMVIYPSILKELKFKTELYTYATNLMQYFPNKRESWFALGCYHMLTGHLDNAIKNFNHAVELDKQFGVAWLGLGHLYSSKGLRDQALRAYVFAGSSMKGSYVPNLMISLEYSLSQNVEYAVKFLETAHITGYTDPYFWHEKGFILYNMSKYTQALQCFRQAQDMKKDKFGMTLYWEPLLNNIGHCLYKLGDYEQALSYYNEARNHNPTNTMLICSIAMTKARLGQLESAQRDMLSFIGQTNEHLFAGSLIQSFATIRHKYEPFQIPCDSFDLNLTNEIDLTSCLHTDNSPGIANNKLVKNPVVVIQRMTHSDCIGSINNNKNNNTNETMDTN